MSNQEHKKISSNKVERLKTNTTDIYYIMGIRGAQRQKVLELNYKEGGDF
ncbi:MAG: hypothetical protein ACFFC7_13695 [Candidatus Hermodarchaeota archaeon]